MMNNADSFNLVSDGASQYIFGFLIISILGFIIWYVYDNY